MKRINYKLKTTTANTTYATISNQDMDYLKKTWIQYLAYIAESDRTQDSIVWHQKTPELPKSKTGMNTVSSFIGGLVNNIVYGHQRDLTIKQIPGIELVSTMFGHIDANFEQIKFIE